MTLGNGPIIILKESGEVYAFSSSPAHLAIIATQTAEQFNAELEKLRVEKGFKTEPIAVIEVNEA